MKTYEVVYNGDYGGFSLSKEAIKMLKELGWKDDEYEPVRHDPKLVQVVKKLGDKAGGSYACLQVAVLSGNKYRIDEYDGTESVIEPNEEEWTIIE